MDKVDFTKLNSANIAVNNLIDSSRIYDISANVNISNGVVNSIDSGKVTKEEVEIASFSKWQETSLNITFNTNNTSEMCTILTEVNTFYVNIVDKINEEPINI